MTAGIEIVGRGTGLVTGETGSEGMFKFSKAELEQRRESK